MKKLALVWLALSASVLLGGLHEFRSALVACPWNFKHIVAQHELLLPEDCSIVDRCYFLASPCYTEMCRLYLQAQAEKNHKVKRAFISAFYNYLYALHQYLREYAD